VTRKQLEGLIDEMAAMAEASERVSKGVGMWTTSGRYRAGEAAGYAQCARMLRGALEENDVEQVKP
jgi:hypothetical protein